MAAYWHELKLWKFSFSLFFEVLWRSVLEPFLGPGESVGMLVRASFIHSNLNSDVIVRFDAVQARAAVEPADDAAVRPRALPLLRREARARLALGPIQVPVLPGGGVTRDGPRAQVLSDG